MRRTDRRSTLKGTAGDERGFILILALVTMMAMTIIGLSLVMNMTTDVQLSRNERDAKTAFQLAEAGINETMSRLHLPTGNARHVGELTGDAGYRTTTWNSDGSKDFGVDVGGDRNSADNLNYAVTISYLDETNPEGFCDSNGAGPNNSGNASTSPASWTCNASPVEIVMYGRDFKLADTATYISYGKLPVYEVTSVGTSNGTTRTVVAYVGSSNLNTDTEGAINTNSCISISGGASNITGGVKEAGGGGCTTCDDTLAGCAAKANDDMTTYLGEDISKIIDFASEKHQCKNATCSASGDDMPASGKIDTVVQDWGDAAGDTYSTMIYIDNSGGKEAEISGDFTGRGILVVTGDLKLSGSLTYEGLIYVFGTLTLSGGGSELNVTGGIMADNTVSINGNITVSYDQATLEDVAKENSTSSIILWKRL
ncbi:MAG: hypothetical protein A2V21_302845 [Deltaproteobacteria bacterium GWC2_55_46]|nr:MAG: hypothetical protein A2Z79_05815 [Deltaproteobacteria bacterium GWA2_55_82]OGQ62382.1 MAG: hypothetical protein A3I81_01230 [Deltaproteobacteria bacterium RIFCSPLOWO2_02_FULL_55_12]OIJ73294.1 MAG: hypothetical protein A2V21_302845 [Deltaproteobacteria bacterium GWC2_55_46]